MKIFKNSVKMMTFAIGFMVTQGQATEQSQLGGVFLGKGEYLQRVQKIQSNHLSSTEFMPELESLVGEMVSNVTEKIRQTPTLNQNIETMDLFNKMGQYAKDEFLNQTMNLNRLNYLCLQMSILLNSDLNKPFRILSAFNVFVNEEESLSGEKGVNGIEGTKLWHLPYDEAYKIFTRYIEQTRELEQAQQSETSEEPKYKHSVEAESFGLSMFRISDRGLNVYPLVAGLPFFGIKTYLEAFAEQKTFIGYPLDTKFEAHSGLIGKGEYAYCSWHDILHLLAMAPSLDSLKNYAHIGAMAQVTKSLLALISQENVKAQEKDLITLFLAHHELVNYSKNQFVLFDGETPQKDVLIRMFEHATAQLAEEIPQSLENKEQHYRETFKIPENMEILNYYENGGLEEISEYLDLKVNAKHFHVIAGGEIENEIRPIHTYASSDFLKVYENARLFSYSIVKLLNFVPDIDRSYGRTYEDYSPSNANRIIAGLFAEFKEKYFHQFS